MPLISIVTLDLGCAGYARVFWKTCESEQIARGVVNDVIRDMKLGFPFQLNNRSKYCSIPRKIEDIFTQTCFQQVGAVSGPLIMVKVFFMTFIQPDVVLVCQFQRLAVNTYFEQTLLPFVGFQDSDQ